MSSSSLPLPWLSAALRDIRVQMGLTQETVSELSGVHVTCISEMERGITQPSFITYEKLARCMGRDIELLDGDGLPFDVVNNCVPEIKVQKSRLHKPEGTTTSSVN